MGIRQARPSRRSRGASLAHLLAHASGLGLEEDSPRVPAGTRRVYSNVGIDQAVEEIETEDPQRWLRDRVFDPLGLESCELSGRPSSGVSGSLSDLASLGEAWCRGDLLSRATHSRFTHTFLPDLWGVTPDLAVSTPTPGDWDSRFTVRRITGWDRSLRPRPSGTSVSRRPKC
jgi:CubicO group peptidase (beta-lactamase class C family)